METLTNEQAIAELRKKGVTETEINFRTQDNKYNRLKSFLFENAGLQGEEDYQKAKEEYKKVSALRAKLFADFEAQAADDPSLAAKIGAIGRGFVQGPAQLFDLGVSGIQAGLETILTDKGMDFVGRDPYNLSKALQDLGLGYYDSQKNKTRAFENVEEGPKSSITGRPQAFLSDMPASTRPFAVAGEEIGLAASMSAPVAMAAKGRTAVQLATPGKGAKPINLGSKQFIGKDFIQNNMTTDLKGLVGGTVDDMVKFAAKNPATFASVEGSIAALSGIGVGVAESIAPGDPNARMIGSVGAPLSFASLPIFAGKSYKIINGMTGGHIEKIKRAIGMKLSRREGAEKATAKLLQAEITKLGGDSTELANAITKIIKENPNLKKSPLSSGLLTGDQGLLAIERSLINSDAKISKEAAEQTKKSINEMNRLFRASVNIADGDPEILRIISQARIDQLNAATGLRVSQAVQKLKNAEANISVLGTPNPQVVKEQAAKYIKKIFNDTYKDLRATENQLWGKIDKTLRLSGTETDYALMKLSSEEGGLVGIELPNVLGKMQNLKFKPKAGMSSVSSGDLLEARSQISAQIRKSLSGDATSQQRDLARRLIEIENGILNDLNSGLDQTVSAQLALANASTRNRYEFLDIPVVNKMFSKTIQGGELSKPDVILDKMLMPGTQSSFQGFNDLMKAGARGNYLKDMQNPLAKFYYAMANQTVNPNGEVDLTALGGFLKKHENGLKALGIYDNLQKPEIQAHLVKRLQISTSQMQTKFNSKSMASKVIGVDATTMPTFFASILKSPNRGADLRRLRNLSLKKVKGVDNREAIDGIRSSIVENLFKESTVPYSATGIAEESTELMLGQKLRQQLDAKQGKNTLRDDLVNSGLFSKEEISGIDQMSKRADEFAASVVQRTEGATLPNVPPGSDFLVDIFGRLTGSTVAMMSPFGQNLGHDLIIAQIGSKTGKNLLDKMPTLKLKEILVEAMQDKVLMKALLEKDVGGASTKSRNLKLGALLAMKGIIGEDEVYAIEDNDGLSEALKSAIGQLAREGNSASDIMKKFEIEARREGTTMGPYKLDQVQSILGMSFEDRASVVKNLEVKKQGQYRLSRRPAKRK